MDHNYFIAKLIDGTELQFDGECNKINYSDPHLCMFMHAFENGSFETLGAIPYTSIGYVKNIKKQVEKINNE